LIVLYRVFGNILFADYPTFATRNVRCTPSCSVTESFFVTDMPLSVAPSAAGEAIVISIVAAGSDDGPSTSARRPCHHGVAESILRRIERGEWCGRRPLPSIRQLAVEYEVGVQAVRLAMRRLAHEGRIRATPRRQWVPRDLSPGPRAAEGMIALVLGRTLWAQWANADSAALQRGIECEVGARGASLLALLDLPLVDRMINFGIALMMVAIGVGLLIACRLVNKKKKLRHGPVSI